MKETDSIVRMQVDALMELLEQSRSAQCQQARESAELQATELRRHARRVARERVSKAAHEERARLEREVRMVEAEIETEQRRRARRRDTLLIETGHKLLAEALAARWKDRAGRAEWAETAVREAGDVLLGRAWVLEHPAGWADDERDRALALARERCGAEVDAKPADGLEAGLHIRSGGALVDMSIPGLLANERSIEGELLAEFHQAADGEQS
jgi:hypothetical protein